MASRALRKLQRQQEIERQVAATTAAYEEEVEESEEEEVQAPQPRNAFDMLNDVEEDEAEESDGEHSDVPEPSEQPVITQPSQATKSKKKKKKQKKKAKSNNDQTQVVEESGDEIDRAVRELAAKKGQNVQDEEPPVARWEAQATKLLAIEQKSLNPTNEMRSLFGNIALETHEARPPPRPERQREINLQGGVDLGTALSGRYSTASRGKELGSMATRRNCFLQGKREWPLALSGGLSMENVPDQGFEKQYNIMHNPMYQQIQVQFRLTVESMQAERMIMLLVANPYHIATLLQVSEIAKHQGDNSVSGDLLERALYSIGRSVHSSFPAATRNGSARLDFDKPANRELYLTIWRYIRNLEMRGTWRTAFEWSKLLLQFSPLTDPCGITLMIDQLALRGRQHTQLIELASDEGYGNAWRHLPNIQISLVLAYLKSQKPKDARRQLAITMEQYPYILSALASALDISPLPKALWGKLPSSDAEKLYTELYVSQAKDLWNTPETTSLIGEVAETLEHYRAAISSVPAAPKLEISLEEARHVMLLEIPSLIALLPRAFTNMATSASDVLPPPTSISDFTMRAPTDNAGAGTNALQQFFTAAGNAASTQAEGANSVIQGLLNWFRAPAGPTDGNGATERDGQALFRAMREGLQRDNAGQEVTDEMVQQMINMHLQEGDGGHDRVDLEGLGMAGGWDYYAERAEASSDEDSMPDLEEASDQDQSQQPQNPRAARVEEAESDDDRPRAARMTGPSILRRIDSDDDDEPLPRFRRQNSDNMSASTLVSESQAQASVTPTPAPSDDPVDTNDPQRLQRWLITAGLTNLQTAFTPSVLNNYVERLKILRKPQQEWIINMVSQRGGKDLADKVRTAASS